MREIASHRMEGLNEHDRQIHEALHRRAIVGTLLTTTPSLSNLLLPPRGLEFNKPDIGIK